MPLLDFHLMELAGFRLCISFSPPRGKHASMFGDSLPGSGSRLCWTSVRKNAGHIARHDSVPALHWNAPGVCDAPTPQSAREIFEELPALVIDVDRAYPSPFHLANG